jgi:hypothetical protein
VLEGGNKSRNTLRNEGEPRRRRRDDRGGDRGDRGDRGGDRGERRPVAAPAPEITGPIVQTAPSVEMAKPAVSIIPPMSAPVVPSWKQEAVKAADVPVDAPVVETPVAASEPVTPPAEENKESHE